MFTGAEGGGGRDGASCLTAWRRSRNAQDDERVGTG